MAHDVRWTLPGTVVALGLSAAGCAGPAPETTPVRSMDLEAQIQTDIASLRALDAFEVRGLVMRLPAQATACYGLPCTDADRVLWDQERRTQGARLATLVHAALPAASQAETTAPASDSVSAALESLRALQIVEVGALVHVAPANNPECYSLPCATDIAAANAINAHTDAVVVAIANATRSGS